MNCIKKHTIKPVLPTRSMDVTFRFHDNEDGAEAAQTFLRELARDCKKWGADEPEVAVQSSSAGTLSVTYKVSGPSHAVEMVAELIRFGCDQAGVNVLSEGL